MQALAAALSNVAHAPKLLALRELLFQCGVIQGEGEDAGAQAAEEELAGSGGGGHRLLVFAQVGGGVLLLGIVRAGRGWHHLLVFGQVGTWLQLGLAAWLLLGIVRAGRGWHHLLVFGQVGTWLLLGLAGAGSGTHQLLGIVWVMSARRKGWGGHLLLGLALVGCCSDCVGTGVKRSLNSVACEQRAGGGG